MISFTYETITLSTPVSKLTTVVSRRHTCKAVSIPLLKVQLEGVVLYMYLVCTLPVFDPNLISS